MNKIKFKKQKDELALHVYLGKEQSLEEAGWEAMVAKIPGLLAPACEDIGKDKVLVYTVTGYVPLKKYVRIPLSLSHFCALIRQITTLLRSMNENALPTPKGLLDSAYGMVNQGTGDIVFAYVPIQGYSHPTTVKKLLTDLGKLTVFDKSQNAKYIRSVWRSMLDRDGEISFMDVEETLDRLEGQVSDRQVAGTPSVAPESFLTVMPEDNTRTPITTGGRSETEKAVSLPKQGFSWGRKKTSKRIGTSAKVPCLFREATGEKICIRVNYFRIGKDPAQSDYVITDNNRISRRHVIIETDGKRYYITDLNSTNHTYVDGQMIPPDVKTEIRPDASIRLADERFTFDLT